MIIRYGITGALKGIGFNIGVLSEEGAKAAFRGTGDKIYNFSDFFIAQKQNMINNPIGIGIVIFLLTFFAILLFYYSFYNYARNAKEKSKKSFYALAIIELTSLVLLVMGLVFLVGTNKFDISKPEQAKMLSDYVKATLPYTLFSLSILFAFVNVHLSLICFFIVPLLYFVPDMMKLKSRN